MITPGVQALASTVITTYTRLLRQGVIHAKITEWPKLRDLRLWNFRSHLAHLLGHHWTGHLPAICLPQAIALTVWATGLRPAAVEMVQSRPPVQVTEPQLIRPLRIRSTKIWVSRNRIQVSFQPTVSAFLRRHSKNRYLTESRPGPFMSQIGVRLTIQVWDYRLNYSNVRRSHANRQMAAPTTIPGLSQTTTSLRTTWREILIFTSHKSWPLTHTHVIIIS